jgi:uncharacterized membrane protein YdjX (TVP38/TMEM64 family)
LRSGPAVVGIVALALASCATIPTPQDANDAVLMLRKYDAWAWAVGIALIWADLVLPIPQSVVMAALGIVYGTVLGGLLGSDHRWPSRLYPHAHLCTANGEALRRPTVTEHDGELVRTGRCLGDRPHPQSPYSIPEAIVFLAGLAGMPVGTFAAALAAGSVPTAFAFAAIGAGWADQPILALVASYLLPILPISGRNPPRVWTLSGCRPGAWGYV